MLDTWFSSGLWPFSTLGWPNTTAPDYTTFYPTQVGTGMAATAPRSLPIPPCREAVLAARHARRKHNMHVAPQRSAVAAQPAARTACGDHPCLLLSVMPLQVLVPWLTFTACRVCAAIAGAGDGARHPVLLGGSHDHDGHRVHRPPALQHRVPARTGEQGRGEARGTNSYGYGSGARTGADVSLLRGGGMRGTGAGRREAGQGPGTSRAECAAWRAQSGRVLRIFSGAARAHGCHGRP